MKSYKEVNRIVYNRIAAEYEEYTKDYLKYISEDIKLFLENLSGKRILDLGSGPGRDAAFFKEADLIQYALISQEK